MSPTRSAPATQRTSLEHGARSNLFSKDHVASTSNPTNTDPNHPGLGGARWMNDDGSSRKT
eukprot:1745191-Alexandrium_andersonii.AAC.1